MQTFNRAVSEAIDSKRDRLAEAVTARQYELQPELASRYGDIGRAKCLQDANYHLYYLSESIAVSSPSLFADYIAWVKVMLAGRAIPAKDLVTHLECIRATLRKELPEEIAAVVSDYIEAGLDRLPQQPMEVLTFIDQDNPFADLAKEYLNSLLRGERHIASRLILDAVESGVSVRDIYLHVFQKTQYEVGRLWQMNRLNVAQEHYCTAATQLVMSQLYPSIFRTKRNGHTLVATSVAGELHEIGIRMVSDFFEMDGWDTHYLGANTPISGIIQTVIERRASALAISATITFHVREVESLIAKVRSMEDCKDITILVGGYPFNIAAGLWEQVGADIYASDAEESVRLANQRVIRGGSQ